MLHDAEIVSMIPTAKPDEARAFYTDTLGLPLTHEDGFGMAFRVGERTLRLTKLRESFTPHPFSIIGWRVADITAAVEELGARGVSFERYSMLEQDELGIWTTPDGGARIAWFKDPDQNVLSLVGS